MRLPIYQIDAFAEGVFTGNPAAVVPLEDWLPDATLQAIAAENNLSETAFFVEGPDGFDIRWFTPTVEVELCGHATLASAYVIIEVIEEGAVRRVDFSTRKAGRLTVEKRGGLFALNFPARPAQPVAAPPEALLRGLGGPAPQAVLSASTYMVVYASEAEVAALAPDMAKLATLDRSVIVTARGTRDDFVSRYFAPLKGIPEDPVTGSAHCTLVPYWADVLGKTTLKARQISARGGVLQCQAKGERVEIAGRAVLYLEGLINI